MIVEFNARIQAISSRSLLHPSLPTLFLNEVDDNKDNCFFWEADYPFDSLFKINLDVLSKFLTKSSLFWLLV
jgi:hypothetical protein